MNTEDRIKILKKVEIFSEVDNSILQQIAPDLEFKDYKVDDFLVHKGTMGNALLIILSGSVVVTDAGHVFSTLGAGDVIGEYYLIDAREHSADVIAVSDCSVVRVSQKVFRKVTSDYTSVDAGVMRFLVNRLRNMNVIEESLASSNREIQKQKVELEEQRNELEQLNATKDKFFSIIAHDLRSPTATLITLSEMLVSDLESFDIATLQELIGDLRQVAHNNLKLLNSLLEWARLQQGRIPFEPKEIQINELIKDVVVTYAQNAKDKEIELKADMGEDFNVFADSNMVSSVLRNLVNNALKYTSKKGSVILSVKQEGEMLRLCVQDTGRGLSEENIKKLFRLDCHFSTTGTANEMGTGLGLILCREFVEKQGGVLEVESIKDQGSIFSFTLPLV